MSILVLMFIAGALGAFFTGHTWLGVFCCVIALLAYEDGDN